MLHTFLTLTLDFDDLPGSHAIEGRDGMDVLTVTSHFSVGATSDYNTVTWGTFLGNEWANTLPRRDWFLKTD
jgi:hypothetical protein